MKNFYDAEAEIKPLIHDDYYLNSIKSMIKGIKYNSILDAGCGDSEVINFLSSKRKFAIDISSERIKYAEKKYPNIFFNKNDITDIKFADDSFDLVIAIEVMEHIPQIEKALSEIIRVSNKYILIQVPFNEIISPEICPNCLELFFPRGHLHSFNENRLKYLFTKHGLKILKIDYFYSALNNIILSNTLIKKYIFNNFIKHGGYISILGEKDTKF